MKLQKQMGKIDKLNASTTINIFRLDGDTVKNLIKETQALCIGQLRA